MATRPVSGSYRIFVSLSVPVRFIRQRAMRREGLEPSRTDVPRILSPVRLPISPSTLDINNYTNVLEKSQDRNDIIKKSPQQDCNLPIPLGSLVILRCFSFMINHPMFIVTQDIQILRATMFCHLNTNVLVFIMD